MRKIIKGMHDLPVRPSMDCKLTAFFDLFQFYGLGEDTDTLSLLSGSMGFRFARVKLPQTEFFELWLAGSSYLNFCEEFMDSLSIPYRRHVIPGDEGGWNQLKQFIDQGKPVLFHFNGDFLHEDEGLVDGPAARHVFKVKPISMASMIGYDEENRTVILSYRKNDGESRKTECPIEDFQTARNKPCQPEDPNNVCYELLIDEEFIQHYKTNRLAFFEKALRVHLERLEGDKPIFAPEEFQGECLSYKQGRSAVKDFILSLQQMEKDSRAVKDEAEKVVMDKLFIVRLLSFRALIAYGSATCFREEFGRGLVKLARQFHYPQLEKTGKQIMAMSVRWRQLIRTIYLVKRKLDNKKEFVKKICTEIDKLTAKELLWCHEAYKLVSSRSKAS